MKNKNGMQDFLDNSYLSAGNAAFIEELYANYLINPNDICEEWRNYFDALQQENEPAKPDIDHSLIRNEFIFQGHRARPLTHQDYNQVIESIENKQVAVLQLINAYRFRGHQEAKIDPLSLKESAALPDLVPAFHGLSESDMGTVFNTGSLSGVEQATLRDILQHLRETYCGYLGAEYMHISSTTQKRWIQERLESSHAKLRPDQAQQRNILSRVIAATGLEKYLHTKYVGQKRFSLEGGESLIPLLDHILQLAGKNGTKEVVMGMAHRGRLNVLINILGKSPATLFQEFEGHFDPSTNEGSGDVKYHQGFSSSIKTEGGDLHLALSFNPSHLEIICPVVAGSVRARQHRRQDEKRTEVMPILIHGDAAFAGQGVVMETFNMSQARGFTIGGSLHIIINNQIGFTTSNHLDARSTPYCTEVARMVQAPVFHVNGDNPEAVLFAAQLAFDFRNEFGRDVVIDLFCYRRHGHSEADEPSATQPMMYSKIKKHPSVPDIYGQYLVKEGVVTQDDIDHMQKQYRALLDNGETAALNINEMTRRGMVDWSDYSATDWRYAVNTQVSQQVVTTLAKQLDSLPKGFILHPRVARIMEERLSMASGEIKMDWGFAETMAYATLLRDGYSVRLSGQDSGRGTFFHRHAVLHDQATGAAHVPLRYISDGEPNFTVIDSLLSEEAVLGFEYGFSATEPKCLTIWEAQFGDFANGAQVVIDQFISSGYSKWNRLSSLVMYLPHGFDGQGPEHSSARLERYLQLCAENNIQVVVPSLPSQMFHLIRRQMLRPYRKPLIIMTPKSLLRHRDSTSRLDDLISRPFQLIINDTNITDSSKVEKVIFCSGKVYFDLLQEQTKQNLLKIAVVRIEQIYPFPDVELENIMTEYSNAQDIVWCQEEPENQGAWMFIRNLIENKLKVDQKLRYAGRQASAAPAVGYLKKHIMQQRHLVEDALSINEGEQ
ncbi:2-oxoglutarate dehydrogenase E1 component [hydrothermal vent metagenome]|uniref:oxoglutarate dehydrogenase (succinyl-transferring) n=1 Tax=hydrothermal vent metagenome TaxID=652676 RepID=A0A3B0ZFP5_9ZZZZ